MKKLVKTNVMRLLDAAKITYEAKEYPVDENDLSGSHAADLMGVDHGSVFKTLVLRGEKTGYMVCCIPVDGEVDLKKAARAAGDKKVEMLCPGRLFSHRDEKEIPPLSGPVGREVRKNRRQRRHAGRPGDPFPSGSGEVCGR